MIPAPNPFIDRFRFGVLLTVLAVCLFGGGASRADVTSLLYLRPVIIVCLTILAVAPGRYDFRESRVPLLLLGGLTLLIALQLVPLPPDIWTALPGRARYSEAALVAGVHQPWRPISLTPDLTWNSLFALLPAWAVLIGMCSISREKSRLLLVVLITFACMSGGLGILQITGNRESPFFLYKITHSGSAVGFFANRNHQAALLALTFPLLRLWTMMPAVDKQRQRARYWIASGIGVFLVPMILVTGSRAGVALGLVGFFGALFLAPVPISQWSKWRTVKVAIIAAIPFAMAAVVLAFGRAIAIQRLLSGADFDDEQRFVGFPIVFQMIKEYFPVGIGFGAFDPVFRGFETDTSLGTRYFNHAHNDLLEIVLTGGLFAALLLIVFLIWYVRGVWIAFRSRPDRAGDVLFARAASIIILILFLASLGDYPLRTPLMAGIFAVAAVWLAWPGPLGTSGPDMRQSVRKAPLPG